MAHNPTRTTRSDPEASDLLHSGVTTEFTPEFQTTAPETDEPDNPGLYRMLIHGMDYGFALCRTELKTFHDPPQFRIIEFNSAFARFSFGDTDHPAGRFLHDVCPELAAACRFTMIYSGGSFSPRNYRVNLKNGQQDLEVTVFPLDPHNTAIMLVDISGIAREDRETPPDGEPANSGSGRESVGNEKGNATKPPPAGKLQGEEHKELMKHQKDLESANRELARVNNAISVLARQIDRKKDDLERKIARKVSSQILPLIEELQQDSIPEKSKAKLDVVSAYLRSLTPDVSRGRDIIISLSPMELRVAMMIKKGFSTEETARILNLSPETVKTHRRSIRRKLNIRNSPINLSTYLKFNLGTDRGTVSDGSNENQYE